MKTNASHSAAPGIDKQREIAKQKRTQKKQIVAAILLFCIAAFWVFRPTRAIPQPETEENVRAWLMTDYARTPDDPLISAPAAPPDGRTAAPPQSSEAVVFRAFEVRRTWLKPPRALQAVVARADILINGAPPLDGENVRFFLLEESTRDHWQVRREISEGAYRWRLGW